MNIFKKILKNWNEMNYEDRWKFAQELKKAANILEETLPKDFIERKRPTRTSELFRGNFKFGGFGD